jgi:CRP/FNR family transcriptional regulator, cyclic AMP receptor protein
VALDTRIRLFKQAIERGLLVARILVSMRLSTPKSREHGLFHPRLGHLTLEETIRAHSFTMGLAQAQIGVLASLGCEVAFAEDELILVDGQPAAAFYLLTAGSVAIELRTPRYSVCVQALGPGEVFGWSALLENQDTLFQVRAREPTWAVRIDRARLQAACKSDPAFAAEILYRTLQVVARRVKATEVRFAEMCGVRT